MTIYYGKVIGRFLGMVEDGIDADDEPDLSPLSGTVTFTPSVSKVLAVDENPPVSIFPQAIKATLDSNGYLSHNFKKGVKLLSPTGDINPSGWTWTVSFDLKQGTRAVSISSFNIDIPAYSPGPDSENPDVGSTAVDLAVVAPIPSSPGNAIVRGQQGDSVESIALSPDESALVFTVGGVESQVPFPSTTAPTWNNIQGKPELYTETEVDTLLSGKSNTGHTHSQSDITNLSTDLAGKANVSHSHPISEVTSLQTTLDGKASLVDSQVPAQNLPAVFRTTDSQPFAADSIWNTPIGTSATFENSTDTATANFLTNTPAINDTLNGYGFYLNIARATDPICVGSYVGSGGATITFTHRIPYDPVISSGSDGSMRVIDGRFAYDYWKTVKVNDTTYTADFITRTDLLGTGRNAGTRAARFPTSGGLIRSHELSKCYIPHALCISISPTTLKRGFVWPAAAEDAETVTYSGQVPMGSFFAIPPGVDISTLGLSQEGYALAECLQNYGMYVGDASGSAAISVDGEAAVVMRSALERMRTDWNTTIFGLLRRVTNVGTTAGAPGPRKVAASGPVGIRADYQETMIDVLTARMRASSGSVIASETCSTPVDPVVSTNSGKGGKTLTWTGWASQYRIIDGAFKRIATPDGSTRILLTSPGIRDIRFGGYIVALQSSGWAYIVASADGSSNHYRFAWTSTGSAQLQKVVGGSMSVVTGSGLPNGSITSGKRVEVMIYGPNIYVLLDGEVVVETQDTTNMAHSQCGLMFPSDTSVAMKDLTWSSVPRLFRKPKVD